MKPAHRDDAFWIAVASVFVAPLMLAFFILPTLLIRGWVLTQLWGWYLVPMGIFPIRVAAAIGLALMVSLLTSHAPEQKADPALAYSIGKRWCYTLINMAIIWLVGWVGTFFL